VVVPLSGEVVSAARAFVFGKLPRHGDFIARGLTAEDRGAWDGWLSAALDRSREDLGESFEAAHEAAPPWRFVCEPGEFGPDVKAGALAPSIDSAGRRFFIVIGGRAPPADRAEAIAEQMEELIYRAFEDNLDADALAAAAQALLDGAANDDDAKGEDSAAPASRWWTAETRRDRPPPRLIDWPGGDAQ
jgi:type VI secretion system protein ImpM